MQGAVFVSLHCFSQITDLKNDLEQTRLLAALGLLEAQNKGTFPAIPISIDRTNDTVYIPRYDLMVECGARRPTALQSWKKRRIL